MCILDNNNFAALQDGQENHFVFAFSLCYLAPRSWNLDVFDPPTLLLKAQHAYTIIVNSNDHHAGAVALTYGGDGVLQWSRRAMQLTIPPINSYHFPSRLHFLDRSYQGSGICSIT